MDTTRMNPFMNIPPGDFVLEAMENRGWTQETLAEVLGVSVQTVSKLVKAKQTVTVEMARRLANAFGQSPQYWLALEANYQLRLAHGTEDVQVGRKSLLFSRVPVAALRKLGWVASTAKPQDVEEWLQHLWRTDDLGSALDQTMELPMAAKRSTAYEQYSPYYAALWFQVARRVVAEVNVPRYNPAALRELASSIARYSSSSTGVAEFLTALKACGVKFVVLSHLPHTYTDGAAFWDGDNPVVVFTGRMNWTDNFWFTVAHEIGHVLLHLGDRDGFFIDEGDGGAGDREVEANTFAQEKLCHAQMVAFFRPLKPRISRAAVEEYAQREGISAALVVGCLHHNDVLEQRNLRDLRQKVLPLVPEEYLGDRRVRATVEAA